MDKPELLKNIEFAQPLELNGLVEYQQGQVVSRTLAQNNFLSLTLFAFDTGEGISAHTVSADALVQVIDGEAEVTIDGQVMNLAAGQVVAMPAGKPHALTARKRFKMMLTVVRAPQTVSL
ncbi:MAG: cupin domain-containing protein [Proteobacteria bacterium]|nr:cupin domain-containing protein [Pseudomonadota bacterium]MBU4276029.1 cupin domain-containing protein [Pseudomonadota bacterium]MBU4384064.1 cupin domain-containing protein [Pseudomonadota bacterium]MCG2763703.1 cupin domain-containing protein [Desulfarculaceae bacterium]